ncbi:AraC family ligand binding domain-containing protein [Thomasclavelia saccharogumia]|uniref:AraC family ligand binding domain-containing protein n=1 Tax=Thomasclavelia saccharogumia TaxID=341225 RepID=UPI000AF5B909|nr:AraC family ligand binding domain-containing protein [Thomasclavelia saccharogumia]
MEEKRIIVYDEQLKIEAYQFIGVMQKFPNHFHDYYVIGFIEKGKQLLFYKI